MNQAITKGFKADEILNILKNGTKIVAKGSKGNDQLRVILNGRGLVIDMTKGSSNYGKIITFLTNY